MKHQHEHERHEHLSKDRVDPRYRQFVAQFGDISPMEALRRCAKRPSASCILLTIIADEMDRRGEIGLRYERRAAVRAGADTAILH